MKHATDPRDKLFALLGFVPSVSLQADYSKPVERVYKGFARAFVEESSTSSVLFLNRFPKSLDLLSWVPDLPWTISDDKYNMSVPLGNFSADGNLELNVGQPSSGCTLIDAGSIDKLAVLGFGYDFPILPGDTWDGTMEELDTNIFKVLDHYE
jgi:hypothetical protein